jgi:hypothetical protein
MRGINKNKLVIVLVCIYLSCCTSNKEFLDAVKFKSSIYLCYITSAPKVFDISEMDSNEISSVKYLFEGKPEENQFITFRVNLVDYYKTYSAYEEFLEITKALGLSKPPCNNFDLKRYNTIYLLNKKSNQKTMQLIANNFRYKKITMFEFDYLYHKNDSVSIMITDKAFDINRKTVFDGLIKMTK